LEVLDLADRGKLLWKVSN